MRFYITSIAAGSARVVPTGMSLAEAAAAAASISTQRNIDFQLQHTGSVVAPDCVGFGV